MIRVLQTHPEACCECVQVLWIVWQVLCKCDTGEREPWPGEEVRPVFQQERIMITGFKGHILTFTCRETRRGRAAELAGEVQDAGRWRAASRARRSKQRP